MPEQAANARSHILIVGAGLAGALMACYLGRAGYRVSVYERRPDPRLAGFIGGRSINLALSTRGITALREVGLDEQVLSEGIPMRGRMMHSPAGDLAFQPYSSDPADAIYSVDRGRLNLTLLNAADEHENVTFSFDHRCLTVDLDQPSASFENAADQEFVEAAADLIVGADGAFSSVRLRMQREDRFNFSQQYLEHGYKELTIPPVAEIPDCSGGDAGGRAGGGAGGRDGFAMDPGALHIWPRGGYMMIALPNTDRSFTCTCFWPFRGETGFEAIRTADDVRPFFERHFPDAAGLMPTLTDDYMANPTSSLITVRCSPWHYEGKVVLIGDAAHAIVPFYGQGMNAAFEDCRVLDDLVQRFAPQWEVVLETFTMKRKVHADAIADLAMDNFIEMRDHVGSKAFLLKKKTETLLHKLFPRRFLPLYNMISFSNIPYADAKHRAEGRRRLARALGIALAAVAAGILAIAFCAALGR